MTTNVGWRHEKCQTVMPSSVCILFIIPSYVSQMQASFAWLTPGSREVCVCAELCLWRMCAWKAAIDSGGLIQISDIPTLARKHTLISDTAHECRGPPWHAMLWTAEMTIFTWLMAWELLGDFPGSFHHCGGWGSVLIFHWYFLFAAKKYLFVIRVEVIIFLLYYSDAGNNVIVKLATRISLKSSTQKSLRATLHW